MVIGTSSPVLALVGAQYGSEGKGVVASRLAPEYDVHVRTGAPNAGHTHHHEGRNWVARSIPVGWVNPKAQLVIGPGALIDAKLLISEIEEIEAAGYDISHRIWIDDKATVIDPVSHHAYEGGVDGRAHKQIGSTGEGVGPARMGKLARTTFPKDYAWTKHLQAKDHPDLWLTCDTVALVNSWINDGAKVLLEGTQGSALSLTHGTWPYVTSTDTNAATLAADAGIAPGLVETLLVARTHPIRVAGNSGPLKGELNWESLGVDPETTTVTKKTRRVGEWDQELIDRAVMLNRPAGMALTFLDYWYPELTEFTATRWDDLPQAARVRIATMETRSRCPVLLVSTGPAGTPILENPGIDREEGWISEWHREYRGVLA